MLEQKSHNLGDKEASQISTTMTRDPDSAASIALVVASSFCQQGWGPGVVRTYGRRNTLSISSSSVRPGAITRRLPIR